jgi:hypothetical protein
MVIPFLIQCGPHGGLRRDTVEARRFVILDKEGKMRGEIAAYAEAGFVLYDSNGKEQMTLSPDHMAFYDPRQANYSPARILLQVLQGEPVFELKDGKGATLSVGPDAVAVHDTHGFESILGVAATVTPATGESRQSSAAALTMFDKNGKVMWQAP